MTKFVSKENMTSILSGVKTYVDNYKKFQRVYNEFLEVYFVRPEEGGKPKSSLFTINGTPVYVEDSITVNGTGTDTNSGLDESDMEEILGIFVTPSSSTGGGSSTDVS